MNPAPQEEEDATKLQLGPDFQKAQCLLISEVSILLEHRQKSRSEDGTDSSLSTVFEQSLKYVQKFNRYKNKQAVKEVRALLSKKNLEEFEIAALANLFPETAEEARTLVPTLKKLDEEELQAILNELSNMRSFV